MKSAYTVLGIPGNASAEDVQIAYKVAMTRFSKEKLVEDPGLVTKRDEITEAYKVLSSAEMRAAHDRKLNAAAQSPVRVPMRQVHADEEPSGSGRLFKTLALLVVLLFGIGGVMQYQRSQREAERAEQQERDHMTAIHEAMQAKARQLELDAAREKAQQDADLADKKLRAEAANASARAAINSMMAANAQANAIAQANLASQRAAAQAQAQVAANANADRVRMANEAAKLRALCYQNYRRYDC